MNLNAYDDMMGLEFGEYEGLDELFNPEMLKEALVASASGGGAILLASWGMKKLTEAVDLPNKITNPLARTAVVSLTTAILGLAAGRQLMRYNMNVGVGVVGGVSGLAMANLFDAVISEYGKTPRMITALGESDDMNGSMSGAYGDDDDGMSALAALEATSMDVTPGAFRGFADPTVTREALMGLEAATVQMETLGEYAPYLS